MPPKRRVEEEGEETAKDTIIGTSEQIVDEIDDTEQTGNLRDDEREDGEDGNEPEPTTVPPPMVPPDQPSGGSTKEEKAPPEVPRSGRFFLHDDRISGEDPDTAKRPSNARRSPLEDNWAHDLCEVINNPQVPPPPRRPRRGSRLAAQRWVPPAHNPPAQNPPSALVPESTQGKAGPSTQQTRGGRGRGRGGDRGRGRGRRADFVWIPPQSRAVKEGASTTQSAAPHSSSQPPQPLPAGAPASPPVPQQPRQVTAATPSGSVADAPSPLAASGPGVQWVQPQPQPPNLVMMTSAGAWTSGPQAMISYPSGAPVRTPAALNVYPAAPPAWGAVPLPTMPAPQLGLQVPAGFVAAPSPGVPMAFPSRGPFIAGSYGIPQQQAPFFGTQQQQPPPQQNAPKAAANLPPSAAQPRSQNALRKPFNPSAKPFVPTPPPSRAAASSASAALNPGAKPFVPCEPAASSVL